MSVKAFCISFLIFISVSILSEQVKSKKGAVLNISKSFNNILSIISLFGTANKHINTLSK